MRGLFKVAGIFIVMAAFGFLVPQFSGGVAEAVPPCGHCIGGMGDCEPLPKAPIYWMSCCDGYGCDEESPQSPAWACYGRCSVSQTMCDCTWIGCHTLC